MEIETDHGLTLLTLAEAAEKLRVSTRTLQREIVAGRLRATYIRARPRIDPVELRRYIAEAGR